MGFSPGLASSYLEEGIFQKGFTVPGYPTAPAWARYRCFLPDLAGLAGMRRVGPGTEPSLPEPADRR